MLPINSDLKIPYFLKGSILEGINHHYLPWCIPSNYPWSTMIPLPEGISFHVFFQEPQHQMRPQRRMRQGHSRECSGFRKWWWWGNAAWKQRRIWLVSGEKNNWYLFESGKCLEIHGILDTLLCHQAWQMQLSFEFFLNRKIIAFQIWELSIAMFDYQN